MSTVPTAVRKGTKEEFMQDIQEKLRKVKKS